MGRRRRRRRRRYRTRMRRHQELGSRQRRRKKRPVRRAPRTRPSLALSVRRHHAIAIATEGAKDIRVRRSHCTAPHRNAPLRTAPPTLTLLSRVLRARLASRASPPSPLTPCLARGHHCPRIPIPSRGKQPGRPAGLSVSSPSPQCLRLSVPRLHSSLAQFAFGTSAPVYTCMFSRVVFRATCSGRSIASYTFSKSLSSLPV